jgi:hypothetical protein
MPTPAIRGALVAAAVLALLALVAPGAAAHANHVSADAQVAANGTVRVEGVLASSESWIAVQAVNGSGGFGEVLGHARVDHEAGFQRDVPVAVGNLSASGDASKGSGGNGTGSAGTTGNDSGARSVAAVLHLEEDGAGFDPDGDPVARAFGSPVADRFDVSAGDAPAYLGVETFSAEPVENASVGLRRVSLAEPGGVTLRWTSEDGSSSAIVGSQALGVGTSRNVSVAVDRPEGAPTNGTVVLEAAIHEAEGDAFDAGDPVVRVGGEAVASELPVVWPEEGVAGSGEPAPGDETETGGRGAPGPGAASVLGVLTLAAAAARRT